MAGGGVKINNINVKGGANGRTATFKIENGHLYNSYNSGVSWYDLGQVNGEDGVDGQDGKGFNPRGDWQPNTTYFNSAETIDVVQYAGNAYYCKVTQTSTLPPSTDTTGWGLFAKGGVSGEFYFGEAISGTDTTPQLYPNTGIANATVGSVYWNMSNGADLGNLYRCDVAGNQNTARWSYVGNISTVETKYDNSTTSISYTLAANTEKTFNASNITSISLTIPSTSYQGFISEVDFFTGENPPSFNITNNSGKPFKMVIYGLTLDSYTPSPNAEINLLFRDNGVSIICAILEI